MKKWIRLFYTKICRKKNFQLRHLRTDRFQLRKKFLIVLSLVIPAFVFSEGNFSYSNFFVQGSYNHYFAPAEATDYIKDDGGFRAGVGYSFDLPYNLSVPVYVESGYSHLIGTNPILLDVKSIPLILFGGVEWSFLDFFSFHASVGMGTMFSKVEHYESVYDMVKENLTVSDGNDFLFALRAGLGFDVLENFVILYADFGFDLILELDGPIPLPGFSLGVRLNQIKTNAIKSVPCIFTEKSE